MLPYVCKTASSSMSKEGGSCLGRPRVVASSMDSVVVFHLHLGGMTVIIECSVFLSARYKV